MSKFFFLRALFVCKSISRFITDGLNDKPQITDDSFFNKQFLSMSSSVKYVPRDYECKYQHNFY